MAMGAETSMFMGSIFIRIIDRTCHWSASENENKENVVLTLKEQTNNKNKTKQKKHKKKNSQKIHWNKIHLVVYGEIGLIRL